ncbi:hypothetical protein ACYOEI_33930, partial [Singulisphaera rosea]
ADLLPSLAILKTTNQSEWENSLEQAVLTRGWFIFQFHAIITPEGWPDGQIGPDLWQACLDSIDQRVDPLWIAPLADVASYVQCRRTALADSHWDGRSLRVWILSDLDRTRPETRLTISVQVPAGWREVTISSEPDTQTVHNGSVTFDLRPDGRQVVLEQVIRRGGGRR